MHAELKHFSTSIMGGPTLILKQGQERVYHGYKGTDLRRIRVSVTATPEELVVITEEHRIDEEVPVKGLMRLLSPRGVRRVSRWDIVDRLTVEQGGEREYLFSEGIGDLGLLTVRAR